MEEEMKNKENDMTGGDQEDYQHKNAEEQNLNDALIESETAGATEMEYIQNKNVRHNDAVRRRKQQTKVKEIKERVKRRKEKAKAQQKAKLRMPKVPNDNDKEPSETKVNENDEEVTLDEPLTKEDEDVQEHAQKGQSSSIETGLSSISDNTLTNRINQNRQENVRRPNSVNYSINNNDDHSKHASQNRTKEKKPEPTISSEMTSSSSGISEKTGIYFIADSSFNATTNQQNDNPDKVLSLCQRGDWIVLEQLLRNTKRGSQLVSRQDQVRK